MEYETILKPGDVILNGKYQVEAPLGRGAFSQVYRVQHLELKTDRAVKVVSQELPDVDAPTVDRFRARFRLEAQLGEQLGHPHIIHVYDFEEAENRLYLIMDCAAGGSLAKLLDEGPLSVDQAVVLTSETAAGLQALHEVGIIHRDVKPSNILLDADGRVKVGDLGLAQVPKKLRDRSGMDSRAAAHPGTPEYMSPEQATTVGYLTPSSDVYSLGCVLFEMLTGELWREVMSRVEGVRELRPEVPAQLEAVLSRMLADEPGQKKSDAGDVSKRYVSMDMVQQALVSTQPEDAVPDATEAELARLFEEAVIAYRWNEWERARDMLEDLLQRSPGYERDGQSAEDILADVYSHLSSSPVPSRYLDEAEPLKPAGVALAAAAVDLEADRDFTRPVASKPTGPVSPFGSPRAASPTVPMKPVTPAAPAAPVVEPAKPAATPDYDEFDRAVPVVLAAAAGAAAVERAAALEPGPDAETGGPISPAAFDDLDALADMGDEQFRAAAAQKGTTMPMDVADSSWQAPPQVPPSDRAGERPSGKTGQGTGRTFWGKLRAAALILFLIWLCVVTVPATALWAFNTAQQEWRIVLLPELFGGPLPANTTPVSELESEAETAPEATSGPVVEPTQTPEMPTATNTPQPTRTPTPVPTVTVVVIDSPAISLTATSAITPTIPPGATAVVTSPLASPTVVTVTVSAAVTATLPATSAPAPGAAVTSTRTVTGEVTTPVLWVRFGPGDNFKASAKLEEGDSVSLAGRTDTAAWLQIVTADGTQGWADARFISTAADVQALAMVESPPTPTVRPTEPPPPTETPTQAAPQASPTPGLKYPAPVLQAPDDQSFWANGRLARNLLEWQSMNLAPDEFYNVTIVYGRNGQDEYFGDYSMKPFYELPESLFGVADAYNYRWRVVVRKIASQSADGKPDGPAISPESEERSFHWE